MVETVSDDVSILFGKMQEIGVDGSAFDDIAAYFDSSSPSFLPEISGSDKLNEAVIEKIDQNTEVKDDVKFYGQPFQSNPSCKPEVPQETGEDYFIDSCNDDSAQFFHSQRSNPSLCLETLTENSCQLKERFSESSEESAARSALVSKSSSLNSKWYGSDDESFRSRLTLEDYQNDSQVFDITSLNENSEIFSSHINDSTDPTSNNPLRLTSKHLVANDFPDSQDGTHLDDNLIVPLSTPARAVLTRNEDIQTREEMPVQLNPNINVNAVNSSRKSINTVNLDIAQHIYETEYYKYCADSKAEMKKEEILEKSEEMSEIPLDDKNSSGNKHGMLFFSAAGALLNAARNTGKVAKGITNGFANHTKAIAEPEKKTIIDSKIEGDMPIPIVEAPISEDLFIVLSLVKSLESHSSISEKIIALKKLGQLGTENFPRTVLRLAIRPLIEILRESISMEPYFTQTCISTATQILSRSSEDQHSFVLELLDENILEALFEILTATVDVTKLSVLELIAAFLKFDKSAVISHILRIPGGMQVIIDLALNNWEDIRISALELLEGLLKVEIDESPCLELQKVAAFGDVCTKLMSLLPSSLGARAMRILSYAVVKNGMAQKLFVDEGHPNKLAEPLTLSIRDLIESNGHERQVSEEKEEFASAAARLVGALGNCDLDNENGDSDVANCVAKVPGLLPALCEIAFSMPETENMLGIVTWHRYGLKLEVCKVAQMALTGLIEGSKGAQEVFSLTAIDSLPELYESEDGWQVIEDNVPPHLALEVLIGLLQVPTLHRDHATSLENIHRAFLEKNLEWCTATAIRLKSLHVAEQHRSKVLFETPPLPPQKVPSKGGIVQTLLGNNPTAPALESGPIWSEMEYYLDDLGLGEQSELEMACFRSALAYSYVMKRTLIAHDASPDQPLNPTSVALSAKIFRAFLECGGTDTRQCLAYVPIHVAGTTGLAPQHRPHYVPALQLALDFLLEGHSLLMRTLHGEVQCKKDQNTPGISLCNHLEDLVKILSLWIYESPQLAEQAMMNGGNWRLLESIKLSFSSKSTLSSIKTDFIGTEEAELLWDKMRYLHALLISLFAILLVQLRKDGNGVTQALLIRGIRRRLDLQQVCSALHGASLFVSDDTSIDSIVSDACSRAMLQLVYAIASHGEEVHLQSELDRCKHAILLLQQRIKLLEIMPDKYGVRLN